MKLIRIKILLLFACLGINNLAGAQGMLTPIEKDGKWGYADENETLLIPAVYDQADYHENGIAIVKKDGRYGFIDTAGKVVVPFKFDELYRTGELSHFAVARIGKKWGFINNRGAETIPFIYELEEEDKSRSLVLDGNSYLSERSFIVFQLKDKYGAITPANKIAIPFEYQDIESSYSWVPVYALKKNGKWAISDTLGKPATQFMYDDLLSFWGGYAVMKRNNKWVFVSETTFEEKSSIRGETQEPEESFAYNGKYGVIDADGKVLIDFKFDHRINGRVFSKFTGGNKEDHSNYKRGILDDKGNEAVPAEYEVINQVYGGFYELKKGGKMGYLDSALKMILPVKYDYIMNCNDVLLVELDKKEAIYSLEGKEMVPFKYDDVSFCYGDLKAVKLNGKAGFIDIKGSEKIPLKYDEALSGFLNGYAAVKRGGKIGFIDQSGKEVIPLKYDEIDRTFDNFSYKPFVKLKREGVWYQVSADGKESQ